MEVRLLLLTHAVPLVGAAAVQADQLVAGGRALAADPSGIRLAMKCEKGCSPKAFCLPPICDGSHKCVTKPASCMDNDWQSCNKEICPVERRSELCANGHGRVCKERLGHEDEEANNRPKTDLGEPSEEPEPGCISINPLVDDEWCVKSCSTDPMGHPCDPEVCKCGAEVVTEKARWKKEKQDKAAKDCVGGEATKCVNGLKNTWQVEGSCNFEATGCLKTNNAAAEDCRTCAAHIVNCMSTMHLDDDGAVVEVTMVDCVDEVAGLARGCSTCNTTASKKAYAMRLGDSAADPDAANRAAIARNEARMEEGNNNAAGAASIANTANSIASARAAAAAEAAAAAAAAATAAAATSPPPSPPPPMSPGDEKICNFEAEACIPKELGSPDCRSCAAHISNCMLVPHVDDNNSVLKYSVDDCMVQVAEAAEGCRQCNTTESMDAYKERVGVLGTAGASAVGANEAAIAATISPPPPVSSPQPAAPPPPAPDRREMLQNQRSTTADMLKKATKRRLKAEEAARKATKQAKKLDAGDEANAAAERAADLETSASEARIAEAEARVLAERAQEAIAKDKQDEEERKVAEKLEKEKEEERRIQSERLRRQRPFGAPQP